MLVIIGSRTGLGNHLVSHFAKLGKAVLAGSRFSTHNISGPVTNKPIDVCDEESVKAFFDFPLDSSIEALVYCAGITVPKIDISAFDKDAFLKVLDTNVVGFVTVMKHLYPHIKSSGSRIVAIGSMSARTLSQYSGFEYTASKQALSGVVRHLAKDFASDGILVNCVHPGPIDTPMLRAHLTEDQISSIIKEIPTKKLTSMKDVAAAVSFLISPENKNITGSGIDVNGGQVTTV